MCSLRSSKANGQEGKSSKALLRFFIIAFCFLRKFFRSYMKIYTFTALAPWFLFGCIWGYTAGGRHCRGLEQSHTDCGKFSKRCKEIYLENWKMHYITHFQNNLKTMRWVFESLNDKSKCGENLKKMMNLFVTIQIKFEFSTSYGWVLAKNWDFGINIIFLQQFFPFRGGGGRSLCPPWRHLCHTAAQLYKAIKISFVCDQLYITWLSLENYLRC